MPSSINPPLDPQTQLDAGDEYAERAKRTAVNLKQSRTIDDVLAAFRDYAGSNAERGRLFERLIKRYLETDPLYRAQFQKVWLWSEWPGRSGPDTGVDLIAQYHPDVNDGGLCAIQCKFYEPGRPVPRGDVSTFLTAADSIGVAGRILVSTVETRPADTKLLNSQRYSTHLLGIDELRRSNVSWPDIAQPERLESNIPKFDVRPDQREAIDKCIEGFKTEDRGKLILPCGVGKTFTALKLAEESVGAGGTVLYLVPSIALLGQAMREWSRQAGMLHRYIGICSDEKAGRQSEDAHISELAIPVTTDAETIARALTVDAPNKMTVVFSTYQSLPRIAEAQDTMFGRAQFDLVLCDEAHRTTGIEKTSGSNGSTSPFVLVHANDRIRAKKRLYMTATPRVYGPAAKTKAMKLGDVTLYSMDEESLYGPEFHRMTFADAVDDGLLSDYKVLVLNIDEEAIAVPLQRAISAGAAKELPLDDAAKLVGCASALFNPTATDPDEDHKPLQRAIAFSTTISASKAIKESWESVVNESANLLPDESLSRRMECAVDHVDGTMNALDRNNKLDWLRASEEAINQVRILSNARCLSEGVDVPALDAVLFMQPKRSQVDVVQAVGRVMRRAPDKDIGYVILPIVIPPEEDAAAALDNNKRYEVVWEVLQALRSHDERLDAEINQIDLNRAQSGRIQIVGVGADPTASSTNGIGDAPASFQYKLDGLVVDHFYARVVERVGDRQYWDRWAKDVADIATRVTTRLSAAIPNNGIGATAQSAELRQRFDALLQSMRATTNDALTEEGAISIVAQHMITGPVFDALYPDYDFTRSNPVARSLHDFVAGLDGYGLEAEMRDLQKFYDSVRRRAEGIDNPNGRRKVLEELYENFFKHALPKEAQRLGVVYTPHELVDFILNSVNDVLKEEFGKSLADEGVHILDPFAGMGTFIWRLIANPDLIPDDALHRKYTQELHANEILPLAYYMATINIEEAYRERVAKMNDGKSHDYVPFEGIVWRDTFNAPTDGAASERQAHMRFMQANDERARRQDETEITVIVGNPPWRGQQKADSEGNPNVDYPQLERRVADTYAAYSTQTNKNGLYNYYKLGMRWGTDRLQGERGVMGLVTSAKYTTSNVDSGIRRAFIDDFRKVECVGLRGDVKGCDKGGGNVFGDATTEPVAISVLTKSTPNRFQIRFCQVGIGFSTSEKLRWLKQMRTVKGQGCWKAIDPQNGHIWFDRNDETFANHPSMGSSFGRSGRNRADLFRDYSGCPKTGKDSQLYGFGHIEVANRIEQMLVRYASDLTKIRRCRDEGIPNFDVSSLTGKWHRDIGKILERDIDVAFSRGMLERAEYRPFVGMVIYREPLLIQREYRIRRVFPSRSTKNTSVVLPTLGVDKPFSTLAVGAVPDGNIMQGSQAFPRHTYDANGTNVLGENLRERERERERATV